MKAKKVSNLKNESTMTDHNLRHILSQKCSAPTDMSLSLRPDTIYYFHWKNPLFPTDCFERWSKWEYFGKENTEEAYDKVTKRNLKLFFHPNYPENNLIVIRKILERKGFTFHCQMQDRIIYQYSTNVPQEQNDKSD